SDHYNIHSFPTRRSSDLNKDVGDEINMLVYGDDEKIKTEMLAIFDLLNGKTSTSLYKNYIKFFKYVEYYHENEENILEIIMTERDRKSTRLNSSHSQISY